MAKPRTTRLTINTGGDGATALASAPIPKIAAVTSKTLRLPKRSAAIFGIGALASAVAPSPPVLIVSRVVLGLAIGLASTNVPVYLSEVAPPHARGWIVSLFRLAVTVGIVVAYLTDYAFAGVEGWRWMLGF